MLDVKIVCFLFSRVRNQPFNEAPSLNQKKDTMSELNTEEQPETTEPSRAQKIAAAVTTVVVTLAIGLAATGLSDKVNKQINAMILKTDA